MSMESRRQAYKAEILAAQQKYATALEDQKAKLEAEQVTQKD